MDERDPEQVPGDAEREPRARRASASRAGRTSGSGTIAMPVAAPAGEVDQLDVEHDAGDLLAREQVVRRVAREALEPALRVLDRPDDPDRRERRGTPCRAARR